MTFEATENLKPVLLRFATRSMKLSNTLKGKDIISLKDLTRSEMELIFDTADGLDSRKRYDILGGKIMASLFFESSTRTRLSFESAMLRLGGDVIGWADAAVSRFGDPAKGETFEDTIRMVENYSDVIVMRAPLTGLDYHPYVAAKIARIPIINAGYRMPTEDIEHPTQALLDMYTIRKKKGRIDGLKIALTGNIRNERTSHSRLYGLAKYKVELLLANPTGGGPPEKYLEYIQKNQATCRQVTLEQAIREADVCLVAHPGLYKEKKFEQLLERERPEALKYVEEWKINLAKLRNAKKDMILWHDLPRSTSQGFTIYPDVDESPHAVYFENAANGVRVRMSVLSLVLETHG